MQAPLSSQLLPPLRWPSLCTTTKRLAPSPGGMRHLMLQLLISTPESLSMSFDFTSSSATSSY